MKKSIHYSTAFILYCLIGVSPLCQAQFTSPSTPLKSLKTSGYAPVNGLKLYYEIHGDGKPLVLLHGSYMNIDMNWSEIIPELAKSHKVIALEMQGHGRTADINRNYSFPALASDVSELLKYLKIDSADILGYSLGGTVAFQLAISYPERVKNLIIISSVFKSDGWIKPARDFFTAMNVDFFENTPIKTEYDRLAPDKSHWKTFVDKMIVFDKLSYDLGAPNIKALRSPLLLINGDNDGVDLNHVAEIYRLSGGGVFGDMAGLPKSQLAIIPGSTHGSLMMQTEKLAAIIDFFLKGLHQQVRQH